MSRTAAKKVVNAPIFKKELQKIRILVQGSYRVIAGEAPIAYKDIELVVDTVTSSGIAKKVAKLRPVGVIKG